jgi:hypothetical protein
MIRRASAAVLAAVLVLACGGEQDGDAQPEQAQEVLPTEDELAAEAEQEITEENADSELDEIERWLDEQESAPD